MNLFNATLISTLTSLFVSSPVITIYIIGIILAIIFWNKYPRVSLLTTIAMLIMLCLTVVNSFLNTWLPTFLSQQRSFTNTQMGLIFTIRGIISTLIEAAAWGLTLWAIFGWRKSTPSADQYPQ